MAKGDFQQAGKIAGAGLSAAGNSMNAGSPGGIPAGLAPIIKQIIDQIWPNRFTNPHMPEPQPNPISPITPPTFIKNPIGTFPTGDAKMYQDRPISRAYGSMDWSARPYQGLFGGQ